MHRRWRILVQTMVLGTVISGVSSPVFCEEETAVSRENSRAANRELYLSQIAKYPALNKEFPGVFEANVQPRAVPAGTDELYLWQMDEYKMLNADFNEVYTRNIEPRPVPATPEELYLRQLEEYKELDQEFYNEHRREF